MVNLGLPYFLLTLLCIKPNFGYDQHDKRSIVFEKLRARCLSNLSGETDCDEPGDGSCLTFVVSSMDELTDRLLRKNGDVNKFLTQQVDGCNNIQHNSGVINKVSREQRTTSPTLQATSSKGARDSLSSVKESDGQIFSSYFSSRGTIKLNCSPGTVIEPIGVKKKCGGETQCFGLITACCSRTEKCKISKREKHPALALCTNCVGVKYTCKKNFSSSHKRSGCY